MYEDVQRIVVPRNKFCCRNLSTIRCPDTCVAESAAEYGQSTARRPRNSRLSGEKLLLSGFPLCRIEKCVGKIFGGNIVKIWKVNSMDSILVMLSSYNGEKYIARQIETIMTQEGDFLLHLTVRDDGSSDQTVSIVKRCQAQYPGRIDLIEGEHIGLNRSFMSLLSQAFGYDYYAFSDQDDIWLPDKIRTALTWLKNESNSCGEMPLLYACRSYLIHDDEKPYGVSRAKRRPITFENAVWQNMCMGHNQVFNQALLKLVRLNSSEEWDEIYFYDKWVTQIAALYGRVLFNSTPFTLYRQHRGNVHGLAKSKVQRCCKMAKQMTGGEWTEITREHKKLVALHQAELKKKNLYDRMCFYLEAKSVRNRCRALHRVKFYRQDVCETLVYMCAYILDR